MTVITGRPKHPAHAHLGRAEAGNKLQHLFHRGWVEFVTRGANTFVIKEKLKMSLPALAEWEALSILFLTSTALLPFIVPQLLSYH